MRCLRRHPRTAPPTSCAPPSRRCRTATASAEGFMDNDGVELDKPVALPCTVTVKQGRDHLRLHQVRSAGAGPVNLRPSMVEACVFYSLIGCLDPDLHFNDGMRDVVRLRLRAAHHHQCRARRRRSRVYQMANLRLVDVILEALAPFHPERAIANSGSSRRAVASPGAQGAPGPADHAVRDHRARPMAAASGHDGASGTATHLCNLHITPIEILESEFPCRITEFDLVPDSGGAGEYRGGVGFRRGYRACWRTQSWSAATTAADFRRAGSPAARTGGRNASSINPGTERRAGRAGRGPLRAEGRRHASFCRARAAAATAIRRSATARRSRRDIAEGLCHAGGGSARLRLQRAEAREAWQRRRKPSASSASGAWAWRCCKHLVKHGYQVIACDVDAKQVAKAGEAGATVAKTAGGRRQGRRAIVILGVGYDDEVNAVVLGKDGVLEALRPGVDHRGLLDRLARHREGARCEERAPRAATCSTRRSAAAAGSPSGQAAGSGRRQAGGGGARSRPVYGTFCSDIAHLGDVGHGQVGKAMNNLLLWVTAIGLIEAGQLAAVDRHRSAKLRDALMMSSGKTPGAGGLGPDHLHLGAEGHADRVADEPTRPASRCR